MQMHTAISSHHFTTINSEQQYSNTNDENQKHQNHLENILNYL